MMKREVTIVRMLLALLLLLTAVGGKAQIQIGGNVYGGGNEGEVKGSTSVTVRSGNLNKVFGGARMADVGGNAYVNIDGKNATGYMVIDYVYGGNDISGTIGTASAVGKSMPTEVAGNEDGVTNEWNTFVHISTKTEEDTEGKTAAETTAGITLVKESSEAEKIYIGQLFGGGNGDFTYETETDGEGYYLVKEGETVVAKSKTLLATPELDKTYVDIQGGSIVYAYGGGNNATVREKTVIHMDNPSKVVNHILVDETTREEANSTVYTTYESTETPVVPSGYEELLTPDRFKNRMGINTGFSKPSSDEFQIGRMFGGNNRADMAIRPTWNLQRGKVRNLYSGGNKGRMTSTEGLLLELDPKVPDGASYEDKQTIQHRLVVDNVYGGCRMSDVMPMHDGEYVPVKNPEGYFFPSELSARVLVRGGDVNNVYGGNDVTGRVYGGNAVGIYTTVRGNIYGGGNGNYPYTDNEALKNNPIFGDLYYSSGGYITPIEALKDFRPNAEQVSIRLFGTDEDHPTMIKGSVFVGGNCATLDTKKPNPLVELKIGSHVIADKVFLGNNGEGMIDEDYLKYYAGYVNEDGEYAEDPESGYEEFSSLDLTSASDFSAYMEGVTMNLQPRIVFDAVANGDPTNYEDNKSYVGSFFCGGNVGSMAIPGKNICRISRGINIFEKFVGGCNNANVEEGEYNAAYEGGVLGSIDDRDDFTDSEGKIKDRLEINLENLNITPRRWKEDGTGLEWNTNKWTDYLAIESGTTLTAGNTYYTSDKGDGEFEANGTEVADGTNYYEYLNDFAPVDKDPTDKEIRLLNGNVYGGCYESGHVNGNVIININEDVIKRDEIFGADNSGVDFEGQRDDVMAIALTVFGAGYGEGTETWGSSTVNLNKGYAFQIFGGGEQGAVGKKVDVKDSEGNVTGHIYEFNPAYSTTVNLNGTVTASDDESEVEDLAESEYLYGGGNMGIVCGNSYANLGNGRIYDCFGGASDADILGHTEVIIGRQPNASGGYKDGFPWVRDVVYGGNDFGGTIHGNYEDGYDFTARIRDYATDGASLHGAPTNDNPGMLESSTYVEYLMGRVDTIFGGGYGFYDYSDVKLYGDEASMPVQESSFVNIRPNALDEDTLNCVFGGSTGFPKNRKGDTSQQRSYVLIDIPDGMDNFKTMKLFGAGSYNGLGMGVDKDRLASGAVPADSASAVIDLLHGQVAAAFGGSFNEGNTRRTVVNVPELSSISIGDIFGGAYGTQILPPCDVYESNVNYRNSSENASVTGAVYGGNNNERRTLYAKVNVSSPIWSDKDKGYLAKVYGAGRGIDTWSEYTEVNLENGARVYEVYGGGEMGHVLNSESVQKYMQLYKDGPSPQVSDDDPYWKDHLSDLKSEDEEVKEAAEERWAQDWNDAWTLGSYYEPNAAFDNYLANTATNLTNSSLVTTAGMDERDYSGYSSTEKDKRFKKYNTNVLIKEGATVVNYAYGGGYGDAAVERSGDVYGTTYIALLGGTVSKDIYAAGTAGAVNDIFRVGTYNASTNTTGFTASANAYIQGGTCRNVYGGGWLGNVGTHDGSISADPSGDIPGETHVVIGDLAGTSFISGIPAIQRNAYGGGEGGAVFGTAHLTMNNGYVGYLYNSSGRDDAETPTIDEHYEEKLEDETKATPNTLLTQAGCVFGGGYIDNSYVDKTHVNIYGGHVRNSAFGGGEIAAIGRGTMSSSGGDKYELEGIYRPGKTLIEMYGGHVHRNVFGGGRGYNNLSGIGSLHSDGYIFGQTEVHIHGGEIGTVQGVSDGDGNVFGGCDIGVVYSAYENPDGTFGKGVKSGERYDGLYQGYYYKHEWEGVSEEDFITESVGGDDERLFTEDCRVLIEPSMKVYTPVTINGHSYTAGKYVTIDDLNTMSDKKTDASRWSCLDPTGIIIHNAVFAGGNTPIGAMTSNANTASVFGNASASIHDIFHRDMITLGTRHTGGLYGDGNLTLVDGYRELNITNYGTDYYAIEPEISIDTYNGLPDREADYYELRYTCLKDCEDKDGTLYKKGNTEGGVTTKASTITADEMYNLFVIRTMNEQGQVVSEESVTYPKVGGVAVLVKDNKTGEWVPNTAEGANFWEESGVVPAYAGRLMNSIQRADLCGVFGSRMVMKGAQDRVPEEVDYTNYTINRVREVSLNQKTVGGVSHGNYFGIYNVVNYLGALTSDVNFGSDTTGDDPGAVRTTSNSNAAEYQCPADGKAYGTATYYDWKKAFHTDHKRNNGNSHNKVALASGVYLELTTEQSTGTGLYEKDWGLITGVVELDLINVAKGIGGGFVYAKNEHGVRSKTGHKNTTLTALNDDAVTQWDYEYSTTEDDTNQMEWQTSGNFVHSTQTIIDDCYNVSNRYMGEDKMPAHYWYIKGSVYVYDQYISAYTGVANAYSEAVDMPLTIAAASHGTMKLLNVQPNLYAFYASPGVKLGGDRKVSINDKTYALNDPISYWDWYLLSKSEQALFIPNTYTNCITCKIDGTEYAAGTYVLTETQYEALTGSSHTYTDAEGNPIKKADNTAADDYYIFRSSNNVGHGTGYLLTYEVNNPSKWDNWYTPKAGNYQAKVTLEEYLKMDADVRDDYYDGPTYRLDASKLSEGAQGIMLGQHYYEEGDLIYKSVFDTYDAIDDANLPDASTQATFGQAFIVTSKVTVTEGDAERHYNPGVIVPEDFALAHSGSVDTAYICTNSIQLSDDEIIYKDSRMTKDKVNGYIDDVKDQMNTVSSGTATWTIDQIKTSGLTAEQKKKLTELATLRNQLQNNLVPAYYCETEGLYGGNFYKTGQNYRGLEAWSSLSDDDHKKFVFNYDALDLLIDDTYSRPEGQKYQYDGANYTSEGDVEDEDTGNKAGYSITQSVDYTATYNGDTPLTLSGGPITVTREVETDGVKKRTKVPDVSTLQKGDELSREAFEDTLVNKQRYYAPISVTTAGTYYVVNTSFQVGSTIYAVGETISSETYTSLIGTDKIGYISSKVFESGEENQTFYYCRETYDGDTKDNVINKTEYDALPNEQKNFTIHGISPTETSTLYVSHESDIYDLSKEKIITVIYQYDYDETDTNGNVTPMSERHVLNIHLTFKSGVPHVEDIDAPEIILPGDLVSLMGPTVTPGGYEVMGGGWELFENERDAESHSNGVDYDPHYDPLYWYQDGYYVAYYAKSYAGRTYSNSVPVRVANYHDLAEVMSDENKAHHMYIDHQWVKRDPKIYINDYTGIGKNGLDLLKNLYDLSMLTTEAETGPLKGHALLNSKVKAGEDLEFFLRTDISHTGPWTPIASGSDDLCFNGTLHGDGHTISGLSQSLFSKLCGEVYNLGVTGSFTGSGVADSGDGYVESCWVMTTGTPDSGVKAVFGGSSSVSHEQTVNCYYPSDNAFAAGKATPMPPHAFYNGEVAYDLNNFYLYKRYNDKKTRSGLSYRYWADGQTEPLTGYYASHPASCSSGYNSLQYVESRFDDGDFRYAAGTIPSGEDERHWTQTVTGEGGKTTETERWSPIWPDDYIFFGQRLNYGFGTEAHQDVPTTIVRDGGRLAMDDSGNRVYRAPAYFRSKTMGEAYFNPKAYLAVKSADGTKTVYPTMMTAIDFAGHNGTNEVDGTYALGTQDGTFYPPLLDDDGLTGIANSNVTKNLLVYAPAETAESGYANKATHDVLTAYFTEPAYSDYYDDSNGYRIVNRYESTIRGHLVKSNLTANSDHLLVDREDFNAPLAYNFDGSHRMWYQRTPDSREFVDRTKGWQGISLPFTAELVTTHQKGEITHFYSGSETSKNGKGQKIGHEYWLRNLKAMDQDGDVVKGTFTYPTATGGAKTVTNRFLWNYYYQNPDVHNQKDQNNDTYLEYRQYYKTSRTYNAYPLLASGTPYILGLPGRTYYEFDLSGNFMAEHTASTIPKLDKQTVTFASSTGAAIGVSDDETAGVTKTAGGNKYAFRPSYMNEQFTATDNAYAMNADGDAYVKIDEATEVGAFRPYFIVTSEPSPSRPSTRSIVFANGADDDQPHGTQRGNTSESLSIYSGAHKIVVSSALQATATVNIINAKGITLRTFDIEPGETIETRVSFSGVYIVQTTDGRYSKKLAVR